MTPTPELRGVTWEHERGHGSMAAAAAAYHEQTGVTVRFEARSLQAFADAPLETLTAEHDLVVIDHPHVPQAAAAGLLVPLDGSGHDEELAYLSRHSVGRSHLSYAHDGHQWALANDAAAQVAAYRPDLVADPPRTWDEVIELARAGRVLWPAKPIDAFSSLLTLAAGAGAPPPAGPGIFLRDEVALQVLDRMHQLTALVPPACLTLNPIQVADLLSSGDRFAYAPLLFGYTNYSRGGFRPHLLRYVDIPFAGAGPVGSLLGGAGIAVSRQSSSVDAAVDFAFWVCSAEVQRGVYFDGGGQPGHAAAWEDDRLNAETLDFFRGTRTTLESAYVRPRSAGFIRFQDEVSPLVTAAIAGHLDDATLVDRMNDAAARHLQDDPAASTRAGQQSMTQDPTSQDPKTREKVVQRADA